MLRQVNVSIRTHINLTVKSKAKGLKNSVQYVLEANAYGMYTEAHLESYNCVEWANQLVEATDNAAKREGLLAAIKNNREKSKWEQRARFH